MPASTEDSILDGQKLRDVRRRRRLSQAALAARAGLSQQAISLYERQVRGSRISYTTLAKLAQALDLRPDDLLVPGQTPGGRSAGSLEPDPLVLKSVRDVGPQDDATTKRQNEERPMEKLLHK